MNVKIAVPTPQEKGYLRRQKKAIIFSEMMQDKKPNADMVDAMADFICEFVVEPVDKAEAKEAILDLSQEDFENIISAISGQPSIPKASGTVSDGGT